MRNHLPRAVRSTRTRLRRIGVGALLTAGLIVGPVGAPVWAAAAAPVAQVASDQASGGFAIPDTTSFLSLVFTALIGSLAGVIALIVRRLRRGRIETGSRREDGRRED